MPKLKNFAALIAHVNATATAPDSKKPVEEIIAERQRDELSARRARHSQRYPLGEGAAALGGTAALSEHEKENA
jgi:hypothetical protein